MYKHELLCMGFKFISAFSCMSFRAVLTCAHSSVTTPEKKKKKNPHKLFTAELLATFTNQKPKSPLLYIFNLFKLKKTTTKYYFILHMFNSYTPSINRNYCHYSEKQIFLLFFQSLSSWMRATCRDVEDVCDERVRYDPREGICVNHWY